MNTLKKKEEEDARQASDASPSRQSNYVEPVPPTIDETLVSTPNHSEAVVAGHGTANPRRLHLKKLRIIDRASGEEILDHHEQVQEKIDPKSFTQILFNTNALKSFYSRADNGEAPVRHIWPAKLDCEKRQRPHSGKATDTGTGDSSGDEHCGKSMSPTSEADQSMATSPKAVDIKTPAKNPGLEGVEVEIDNRQNYRQATIPPSISPMNHSDSSHGPMKPELFSSEAMKKYPLSHFDSTNISDLTRLIQTENCELFNEHTLLRQLNGVDHPFLHARSRLHDPIYREKTKSYYNALAKGSQSITLVLGSVDALLQSFLSPHPSINGAISCYPMTELRRLFRTLGKLDFHPPNIFPSVCTSRFRFRFPHSS